MEVQTTERVTVAATLVFNQFSIVQRMILMLEHSQHRDKSREMAGPVESGLAVQTRTETGFILHSLTQNMLDQQGKPKRSHRQARQSWTPGGNLGIKFNRFLC